MFDVSWFKRFGPTTAQTGTQCPLTVEQVRQWATRCVVSVDTSKGTGANAARTAIGVWCELHGRGLMDGAYLVDAQADPIGVEVQMDRIKATCARWKPHTLLIEDKSTGETVIPMLRSAKDWVQTPVVGVIPGPGQDKVTRAATCTPQIRDGQVWLPERGSPFAWLAEVEKELTFFPRGKFKDLVDMLSQFLNWRRENPVFASVGMMAGATSPEIARAIGGPWQIGGGGGRAMPIGGGRRRGW